MASFDQELDTRGLNCPLPILKAKKAIRELPVGNILRITATDPSSVKDFDAFCQQSGNELVESSAAGGEYTFFIRKS